MTDKKELIKEIGYIVDDVWSGVATQNLIAEEMVEKMNELMRHLRILREELNEDAS
jgi:hypothetical protein